MKAFRKQKYTTLKKVTMQWIKRLKKTALKLVALTVCYPIKKVF